MQSVFSTLREALRPGDAPRYERQNYSSLASAPPKQQIPLRQHEQESQQQLRDDYDPNENKSQAFPEAHRDATGHKTVLDSIMPGNQGLSGKPGYRSDSNPAPTSSSNGSGILGALDSTRRRRSSATSSREEAGSTSGNWGFRRLSVGSSGGEEGGNYTYDTFSGTRSSNTSARPRAPVADSNIMDRGAVQTETLRDTVDKLPGAVTRESQLGC